MSELAEKMRHLAALHAALCWLWSALVSALIANEWTAEQARKAAQRLKDVNGVASLSG
jgi:hypothetical protein